MSNIGINDKMYVVILFVKLSKGCKRMLKNNIETDVKEKCNEADMTQVEIAEAIGTTKSYVNRVIKKQDGIKLLFAKLQFVKRLKMRAYKNYMTPLLLNDTRVFYFYDESKIIID